MLVDAAKHGDVEIPVFCYEPKLGNPVGACRMCLVEIEGIGKLQTGCSTPVKDGMVVHTQTERVKEAQKSVVEFLLINHPLDCPVCDKGGECPLQDISFGWGGGISRFIEPKRHFVKPLELSPKIAIDRERCILCYRCVRFSQEISEDYQLVLLERGAHSFVSTFDGHPYVAPFSGNIIELCPVGALTSRSYRFRARPWDIEDAGTVCTLCPAQCNVRLTVRDERVMRVLSRENDEVDDGWLCDRGRFAFPALAEGASTSATGADPTIEVLAGQPAAQRPLARRARRHARERAAAARRRRAAPGLVGACAGGGRRGPQTRGAKTAALAGSGATNEEGFLLSRLLREALDSPHLDSRPGGALALQLAASSQRRACRRASPTSSSHTPCSARLRPARRRADPRPAPAQGRAPPRDEARAARRGADPRRSCARRPRGCRSRRGAGDPVGRALRLRSACRARGPRCSTSPPSSRSARPTEAGLLEIPATSNGRGLRESGVLSNAARRPDRAAQPTAATPRRSPGRWPAAS